MTRFSTPALTLNDGKTMPQMGFGTCKIADDAALEIVGGAVDVGYELVDSAAIHENEGGVGRALANHPDIFLTTKIWNSDQGYRQAREAFNRSLARLGRDTVDLLLIHWPCPDSQSFVDTWKAFVDLRLLGKVGSIGVSNFRKEDLATIITETGVKPVVNQIELHPGFQQHELRAFHAKHGIVTQSWSPLGQSKALETGPVAEIAAQIGKPPAAVVLAWHLHHGLAPIPKASSRAHMEANFAAADISLTDEQVAAIDSLDSSAGRIGPDPAGFH